MVDNPYESPLSPELAHQNNAGQSQHSRLHVLRLLAGAIFVSFIVTPGLCVLAWLQGYGLGGMHELQSGYAIRGILTGSVFLCPIHLLTFLYPKKRATKLIGYATSGTTIALMSFYWFAMAAAIASV